MKQPEIENWQILHSILSLSVVILYLVNIFTVQILSIIVSLDFFIFVILMYRRQEFFGIANIISITRLVFVIIAVMVSTNRLILFSAVMLNLVLDYFDGKAARKFQQASDYGAGLDIEIDASVVLLAILIISERNIFSVSVIFVGILRYIFVLSIKLFNLSLSNFTSSIRSKSIGLSLNITILTAILLKEAYPLLVIVSILTIISFIWDFVIVFRLSKQSK